ncbi:hypothetical protein C8R44DRAFT_167297 [Mycena epipterygia]|nr:hypothetical protein C8R44DRAFT_167297 [Mycena epipterygia]
MSVLPLFFLPSSYTPSTPMREPFVDALQSSLWAFFRWWGEHPFRPFLSLLPGFLNHALPLLAVPLPPHTRFFFHLLLVLTFLICSSTSGPQVVSHHFCARLTMHAECGLHHYIQMSILLSSSSPFLFLRNTIPPSSLARGLLQSLCAHFIPTSPLPLPISLLTIHLLATHVSPFARSPVPDAHFIPTSPLPLPISLLTIHLLATHVSPFARSPVPDNSHNCR